ncbi:MAG: NAD(P)/FAD-dependent oxidoreductase [Actinomycetota bacterium]
MRVLILGGGFGGVSTAHQLRLLAPEHEVVLVSRSTTFMMGFRKNAALLDPAAIESGSRPLSALDQHGIRVVQGDISSIDTGMHSAEVAGETIEADALVVALGAETLPDAVPGLAEHGHDFYNPTGIPAAAEALASMKEGRIAIGIFGAPYTCPPAPYELALLIQEAAESHGSRIDLQVFTPQPMSLPVLGTVGCQVVEGRLGLRGIGFTANAKAESVEAGKVSLENGDEIPFDLLLAVPPHRCPQVLVDAGLAEAGGWVKVSPRTLETAIDGVWAVGDCTGIPLATKQPLPKAGVLAESEGKVVAERIAATFNGIRPEAEFDGAGACYLEIGGGEAMMVRGRFLAEPAPEVELVGPSPELLEEKARYERETLERWFGAR